MPKRRTVPVSPPAPLRDAGLSEHEEAIIRRLVFVLRDKTYWLNYYIQALLEIDSACGTDYAPVEKAEEALKMAKSVIAWEEWMANIKATWPCMERHPSLAIDAKKEALPVPDEEGDEFMKLVKLWRLEHPEPERPREKAVLRVRLPIDDD